MMEGFWGIFGIGGFGGIFLRFYIQKIMGFGGVSGIFNRDFEGVLWGLKGNRNLVGFYGSLPGGHQGPRRASKFEHQYF